MSGPIDIVLCLHNAFRRDTLEIDDAVFKAARSGGDISRVLDRLHITGEVLDYHAKGEEEAVFPAVDKVAPLVTQARRELGPGRWMADFGCGRVWAGCAALPDQVWSDLCRMAGANQGHVVLEKAPALFKARNEVFGPVRPEWGVLRRIKNALDPRDIFAPGRLPGARSRTR